MKKIILILFAYSTIATSCATIFANNSACHTRPAHNEPQRRIRVVPIVFDLLIFWPSLIIDFADGAIYKPCNK